MKPATIAMRSFYRDIRALQAASEHQRRMVSDPEYRERVQAADRAEVEEMLRAEEERKASEKAAIKADSEYFTSAEFREEVIEALMEAGATRQMAEGRTRDQVHLFAEARELGLM